MMDRRDLLIGAGCALALGAAEYLRPRRHVELMPRGVEMEDVVPDHFGPWRADHGGAVVLPPREGTLAAELYEQILTRSYANRPDTGPVMLLVSYGRTQSDSLQLHRPEVCYPAVGFRIIYRQLRELQVAPGVVIPVVHLTAQLEGRTEDIVYFARLGEDLPQTEGEQRSSRLRAAMAGTIGDGALIRASVVRGSEPVHAYIDQFLRDMVLAVRPDRRASLIGTQRANLLRQIPARSA